MRLCLDSIFEFQNHPELLTTGITLEDIKQRVALVNGAKKLMFGGQKTGSPIPKLRKGPKKRVRNRGVRKLVKQEKRSMRLLKVNHYCQILR